MHYFSTNRVSPHATFSEAVLKGQPDDRGLYFPSEMPQLPAGLPNLPDFTAAVTQLTPSPAWSPADLGPPIYIRHQALIYYA